MNTETCDHNSCLNGGECIVNWREDPACQCDPMFSGPKCQFLTCKSLCFYNKKHL